MRTSDTSEALNELRAFLRLVGYEFKLGTECLVVVGKPFNQQLAGHHIQLLTSGTLEVGMVLCLLFSQIDHLIHFVVEERDI